MTDVKPDFEQRMENARSRAGFTNSEGKKIPFVGVVSFLDQIVEYRQLLKVAGSISRVLDIAAHSDTNPLSQRYPRRITDAKQITDETMRLGPLTPLAKRALGHEGWPLAEVIDRAPTSPIAPFTLRGILLSRHGDVFSYTKRLRMDYPRASGVDMFGYPSERLFDGVEVEGDVRKLLPLDVTKDVNLGVVACERAIRSISGPLELADLLAGLAVAHNIDVSQ